MNLDRIYLDGNFGEWNQLCCLSDLHFGSQACDKSKLINYLDEAVEKKARILIIGDIFDLLLPKDMKRFKLSVLDDFLKDKDDIINTVVNEFYKLMQPYIHLIDLISLGNHEDDLIKYHSINPIYLVVEKMNQYLKEKKINHKVIHGGYIGYLQYVIKLDHSQNGSTGSCFNILYFHGKGGEAPVSKGMIDINRMKANFLYDLHLFGHKHNLFADSSLSVIPSSNGIVSFRPCKAVQCGTFHKTYNKKDVGNVSFAERSGFAPKETGGSFVKFRWDRQKKLEIRAEV